MSRWLAAFRARHPPDAEAAESASLKSENPEKGENTQRAGCGAIEGGASRDIRGIRDIRIIARAASLALAAADAFEALKAADPALDAERTVMAAFYAEPVTTASAQAAQVYCFPCGKPVLLAERTWSDAGGWCCAACLATRAAVR